jgi:hypothetical protein
LGELVLLTVRKHIQLLAVVGVLIGSAATHSSAIAQTTGIGGPTVGLGLTSDHKRTIYRETAGEAGRLIPEGSEITIGAQIPDAVILNEIPISVKDRVGLLRDFKFARDVNESIVIVDPAKRQIVDIVTKADGER